MEGVPASPAVMGTVAGPEAQWWRVRFGETGQIIPGTRQATPARPHRGQRRGGPAGTWSGRSRGERTGCQTVWIVRLYARRAWSSLCPLMAPQPARPRWGDGLVDQERELATAPGASFNSGHLRGPSVTLHCSRCEDLGRTALSRAVARPVNASFRAEGVDALHATSHGGPEWGPCLRIRLCLKIGAPTVHDELDLVSASVSPKVSKGRQARQRRHAPWAC